jgi:transposase
VRAPEVTPNGENATLEELEVALEAAPNKRSYVRLGAIRALLMGVPRAQVCRLYHRSDRLIRLWIERFNRGGIDALASKPRTGRPPKVRWQRLQDLLVPVLEGPSKAGQLHWTGVKLQGWREKPVGLRVRVAHRHWLPAPTRLPLAGAADLARAAR